MTRFICIRHAATEGFDTRIAGRVHELELSPLGRAQAQRLAARLADQKLSAVYSSPQKRARETAQALTSVSAELRVADELDEINYGDWTGLRFEDLQAVSRWCAFNTVRSCTRIPRGELFVEVQARVVLFMERLCEQHSGETVALVTHADVIRGAFAYYLGIPIDLSLRIDVSPASVSILTIDQDGPGAGCINSTES